LYGPVFDRIEVGHGTRLLDIGCGAGLAAQLALARGASVAGIDASPGSLEIARERTPHGDFQVGDMSSLPWSADTFDVASFFNSLQFAVDPVAALGEARRVTRPNGRVAALIWGTREECELATVMAAEASLLSTLPPDAPGPFALSPPGKLEALMEEAGLTPIDGGKLDGPFTYPDADTACRGLTSSGLAIEIIRQVGEDRLRETILKALEPYRQSSGGYLVRNVFRFVLAVA
jgi:SAM-dependent methyltransferase